MFPKPFPDIVKHVGAGTNSTYDGLALNSESMATMYRAALPKLVNASTFECQPSLDIGPL